MPRSVRIQYAGAVYHVMCRGDRREAIFLGDDDRQRFLETLEEVCDRTGFRVHSYVLMTNHYHLLLETPEANLVEGMKWFQGTYTQRFNRRNWSVGHVFQGRYKAIPVELEAAGYFQKVSEYIHLNPARAGLLDGEQPQLNAYLWSSFPRFTLERCLPFWLQRERVFAAYELPDEGRVSRQRYGKLLALRVGETLAQPDGDGKRQADWRELRRGWYLGSAGFGERLMELAENVVSGHRRSSYRAESLLRHDEMAAEEMLTRGIQKLRWSLEEAQKAPKSDPRKQGLAWLVKRHTVVGDEWLIRRLNMGHRSNISRAVSRYNGAKEGRVRRLKGLMHICAD